MGIAQIAFNQNYYEEIKQRQKKKEMGSQNLVLKVKTINSSKKKKNQLGIDQIAVNRKGYEVINQKKSKTN